MLCNLTFTVNGFWVTEWNYWEFTLDWGSLESELKPRQKLVKQWTVGADDFSIEESEMRWLDDKNSRETNKTGEEEAEKGETLKNYWGKMNTSCS